MSLEKIIKEAQKKGLTYRDLFQITDEILYDSVQPNQKEIYKESYSWFIKPKTWKFAQYLWNNYSEREIRELQFALSRMFSDGTKQQKSLKGGKNGKK